MTLEKKAGITILELSCQYEEERLDCSDVCLHFSLQQHRKDTITELNRKGPHFHYHVFPDQNKTNKILWGFFFLFLIFLQGIEAPLSIATPCWTSTEMGWEYITLFSVVPCIISPRNSNTMFPRLLLSFRRNFLSLPLLQILSSNHKIMKIPSPRPLKFCLVWLKTSGEYKALKFYLHFSS